MLWLSLRTGFGNTAFVAALALLPLIALAEPPARHDRARTEMAALSAVPDLQAAAAAAAGVEREAD